MDESNCFGYYKGKCQILNVRKCQDPECAFYKTKKQFEQDRQKALERINSLDELTRERIIELYYDGRMELLEGEEAS
ncbi:hypothetical protein F9B85_03710 [Heliorestis acidaminivorans]|uniref:Uncharacterized protein n=1 Tax=Heliorestis acidaminivorans TaxID=553427 RepID=A0A6I0ESZ4_9FIRM|nr:hypothetical protein [Heliorestis acidaminivorans]KAB2953735.1 hypothetical protein F9B85_03710 [Heliorestis acidaminivorans]